MNKTLWREVAVTTANELYKSEDKLIACHRKEADNDFLTAFIGELKDKVQVQSRARNFQCKKPEKVGNLPVPLKLMRTHLNVTNFRITPE